MKINLKKISIILLMTMLCTHSGYSFDLDETVDDEIRKNYHDTKLIEDTGIKVESNSNLSSADENLPELPNIIKSTSQQKNSPSKSQFDSSVSVQVPKTIPYNEGNTKINKGTTFAVSNLSAISDWQTKGTAIKFKTKAQVNGKNYTIPAGTIFTGEVTESHQPQITCNGGLVAIRVYSMQYKGQTIPLSAYVTKANDKKIFFNDIKGERKYLKTVWQKGNFGRSLFNKMLNLTISLGSSNSTLILSPFPIAYGTICLGTSAIVSPITAFFSKGGHVSIPAGSNFKLKLSEPAFIN